MKMVAPPPEADVGRHQVGEAFVVAPGYGSERGTAESNRVILESIARDVRQAANGLLIFQKCL